jgi:hypothetical protein
MTTTQWILNLVLLAWVLSRNLGTRPVRRTTFVVPALLVALASAAYLRDVPTQGNDGRLELVGAVVGVGLGVLSALLTRVGRAPDGRLVVTAGAAFAALWVAVIGGRVAFAEWATHDGARAVGEFSMRHAITGAGAWTAAFVLLALGMVAGRYATTGVALARRSRETAVLTTGGAA